MSSDSGDDSFDITSSSESEEELKEEEKKMRHYFSGKQRYIKQKEIEHEQRKRK